MAGRKKTVGKCRICGKEGELSFEHVPPKSAFNKATVIEYSLNMLNGPKQPSRFSLFQIESIEANNLDSELPRSYPLKTGK